MQTPRPRVVRSPPWGRPLGETTHDGIQATLLSSPVILPAVPSEVWGMRDTNPDCRPV